MSSFRVLNQAPQYFLPDGRVNAGGKLFFFETDLTTPRDTWSDEAMTTLNSNPVVMDAAGRTLTDVWGDGEYGVVMSDADGVVIWTRNNVQATGDGGLSLPALGVGQFWSSDGSNILAVDIIQVADPTGHADNVYKSDGVLGYWAQFVAPDIPATGIEETTTGFRIGNKLVQVGTGTFPASGLQASSVTVTFGTAFSGAPLGVWIQMGMGAMMYLHARWDSSTATQFGATADSNISGSLIMAAQPFTYLAIGPAP